MESNASTAAGASTEGPSRRLWGWIRIVVGIAFLAFLYRYGSLDLTALRPLASAPWTVAAACVFILASLPLAAWRWGIVLRALDLVVPCVPLMQITCTSTLMGQILFGPTTGDAARGVWAWRLLRRGGGRIAVSILVDRAVGLLALLVLAALTMILRWDRVRSSSELTVLALSLITCLVTAAIAVPILLAAPSLLSHALSTLARHPRAYGLLVKIRDVLTAFRRRPRALTAALGLSLLIQGFTIISFLIIAHALQIGDFTMLDVSVAAPLALVANVLPFTPGGLGVGEGAFDQICRWLAPTPTTAAYASIFFAFRAVAMITIIPGLISLVARRRTSTQQNDSPFISGKPRLPPARH